MLQADPGVLLLYCLAMIVANKKLTKKGPAWQLHLMYCLHEYKIQNGMAIKYKGSLLCMRMNA